MSATHRRLLHHSSLLTPTVTSSESLSSSSLIQTHLANRILTITVNAGRRNALSLQVLEELAETLRGINPGWKHFDEEEWEVPIHGTNEDVEAFWHGLNNLVRVVILKTDGRIFSSGHDLSEIRDKPEDLEALFEKCAEVMTLLRRLPQSVIAQVHGLATAAGCQLVVACDLAVASDKASFQLPGMNIGTWCHTPSIPLLNSLPPKLTLSMLLTAQPILANEALSHGLISHMIPHDQLLAKTAELANKIAQSSGRAAALGKHSFWRMREMRNDKERYEFANKCMVFVFRSSDGKEGVEAFFSKRSAEYKN